jgi:hypothetical protein
MSQEDSDSLQRQLDEARENLRIIQERKATFVLSNEAPLQLDKEERHLLERIAELEQQLAGQPAWDDTGNRPERLSKGRSIGKTQVKKRSMTERRNLIVTLLPAILTGVAGIIAAFLAGYFSYRAGVDAVQIPLQATQTAEAKLALQATPAATVEATPSVESTVTPMPVPTPPRVSLASISYIIEDGGPYRIDLRTASTSGIPVQAGQALQLVDLWFSSLENAPDYGVQAEIYENDRLLGATSPKPLVAGLTKLDSVQIKDYSYPNSDIYPDSWSVQPSWKDLQVFLVTYLNGQVVDRGLTIVHLTEDGTAWFIEPPNVRFVSIVYTVNDGPQIALDMRDAWEVGFGAGPGDKLTLQEICVESCKVVPVVP